MMCTKESGVEIQSPLVNSVPCMTRAVPGGWAPNHAVLHSFCGLHLIRNETILRHMCIAVHSHKGL